jgi:hypothetical protein
MRRIPLSMIHAYNEQAWEAVSTPAIDHRSVPIRLGSTPKVRRADSGSAKTQKLRFRDALAGRIL